MRARRTLIAQGVGLTLVLFSLVACGDDSDSSSSSDDSTIKIGAITPASGPYAVLGEEHRLGYDFAADYINENGGILGRDVEIIHADNKGTPEGSVAAAERLVQQDGARFLIGTIGSPEALAVTQRLEALDALMVGTNPQADSLTGADCNSRFFRANISDSMSFNVLRAWVEENPIDTWDSIGADYSWGRDSAAQLEQLVTEQGGTVQTQLFPPLGTTDYAPYLSDLDGAAALMVTLGGGDALNFFKQASDFGMLDKYDTIFGNAGAFLSVTLNALQNPALNGQWGSGHWSASFDSPETREFVDAFTQSEGKVPGDITGWAYLGMETLFAGIEAAESDEPGDVASALEDLTFDSIKGEVSMRGADHQLLQAMYIGQVEEVDGVGQRLVAKQTIPADVVALEPSPDCQM